MCLNYPVNSIVNLINELCHSNFFSLNFFHFYTNPAFANTFASDSLRNQKYLFATSQSSVVSIICLNVNHCKILLSQYRQFQEQSTISSTFLLQSRWHFFLAWAGPNNWQYVLYAYGFWLDSETAVYTLRSSWRALAYLRVVQYFHFSCSERKIRWEKVWNCHNTKGIDYKHTSVI